jgi:transcription initiation factor TFIIE subunit alpha
MCIFISADPQSSDLMKTKKSKPHGKPANNRAKRHVALKRVQHKKTVSRVSKKHAKKSMKITHSRHVMRVVEKTQNAVNKRVQKDIIPSIASVAGFEAISIAMNDENFSNYVARGIGKRAKDIITLLANPQTDDLIAQKLDIKINEVRRMLNMLNTYGVARYNVNKDSRGWLTFKWYIDANKLEEMREDVLAKSGQGVYKIPESCNDFFLCEKCYGVQKTIFPFETAFEMSFKCDDCGAQMKRVDKAGVVSLVVQQEGKLL